MDETARMSDRSAREAILDGFRILVLEAGFEKIRVVDVIERAGVARSTFYEHFQNRLDLLRDSTRTPFGALAQLASPACDIARVAIVLDHFASQRALVRSLMWNPGTNVLIDLLAEVLQESSASRAPFSAHALAGALLSMLAFWIDGKDAREALEVAHEMRKVAIALQAQR